MRDASGRKGLPVIAWQAMPGAVVLLLWQWGATTGRLDHLFFSRPTEIAARLYKWLSDGTIWSHLGTTLSEAALSFIIGVTAGVAIGCLLARVTFLSRMFDPYVRILNALPRVVLAPIFLLWFGLGIWSKVALGVTVVFFVVFYNSYQGVREVDPVLLQNARMLGASERDLFRHVIVPSASGWIFSSLHISVGFAIISVVVGEYLGSASGIGYLIAQAEGVFDTTGVFAGIALLMAAVLVVESAVAWFERRLLRWRPEMPEAFGGDVP
jgi:NitT/TauT family transport system permease protein